MVSREIFILSVEINSTILPSTLYSQLRQLFREAWLVVQTTVSSVQTWVPKDLGACEVECGDDVAGLVTLR